MNNWTSRKFEVRSLKNFRPLWTLRNSNSLKLEKNVCLISDFNISNNWSIIKFEMFVNDSRLTEYVFFFVKRKYYFTTMLWKWIWLNISNFKQHSQVWETIKLQCTKKLEFVPINNISSVFALTTKQPITNIIYQYIYTRII